MKIDIKKYLWKPKETNNKNKITVITYMDLMLPLMSLKQVF